MELHIVSIFNYFQPSVCLYFSQRTFSFFKESWSGYFRQKIGPGTMEGYFWLFKKRLFIKHRNGLIGDQCTLIWGYHSPVQHRRSFPILIEVLLDETLQLQDPPVAAVLLVFDSRVTKRSIQHVVSGGCTIVSILLLFFVLHATYTLIRCQNEAQTHTTRFVETGKIGKLQNQNRKNRTTALFLIFSNLALTPDCVETQVTLVLL